MLCRCEESKANACFLNVGKNMALILNCWMEARSFYSKHLGQRKWLGYCDG
jgi:hypothetical protein